MADQPDGVTMHPLARLAVWLQPPCPESVTRLREAMNDLDPVSQALRARLDQPTPAVRITASNRD